MKFPGLFLVGVTHRTAPFGFRERLALGAEGEAALAAELGGIPSLREFVILNTCNRVEIYGVAEAAQTANEAAAAYCRRQGVPAEEFARFRLSLSGEDVVGHLLEVSAGLDSQILGETEIFGQVKRAYAAAQARGSAGAILNRLFQKSFQAAKHVRTATAITTGQVSVANVAVDIAASIFGSIAELNVVLIGAGEMGEKAGRALHSRGARRMSVASRRFESAAALADQLEAEAFDLAESPERIARADVIVCSLATPTAVLTAAALGGARESRTGRPLLLVDLGMPRNVEAAAARLANTYLYNLDDLAGVAERNRQARMVEAERCRAALAERRVALWRQLESAARPEPACPGDCANCPGRALGGDHNLPLSLGSLVAA